MVRQRPSTQAALDSLTAALRLLLSELGEDPDREGLVNTPSRMLGAFLEGTDGYEVDAQAILAPIFHTDYDEIVCVSQIPFSSLCEHHMMPFWGHVDVAYLPKDGQIIGLSKVARLVRVYSRRLQVQERLTEQIATTMFECPTLSPAGVAVIVTAQHSCMQFRGVRSPATTTTSCMRGVFRSNPAARAECLSLIGRAPAL